MHTIENQYTEFVLDALRDPQPVQVDEQRRDVVVKLCTDCETCGGINDRLQSVQLTAWHSGEGDVAVIQFGHDHEFVDILLPFICAMCNASLREGVLPVSQKIAIVTPVVKKPGLDPDEPQSYRSISNLTFMSKIIERIVDEQMRVHLTECDLMPPVQSAYRQGLSTEMALLKVIGDIIDAADNRKVTLLGLLDVSAALDTVDHQILLRRLQVSYGIGGQVRQWLTSFLTDRTQLIAFSGVRSTLQSLLCGVPQGSVLGPLLFALYSADVIKIAASHGVCIHAYADNMQTYAGCAAPDQQIVTSRLLACVADIEEWITSNRLTLNADKTEFIWLGTHMSAVSEGQFVSTADKWPVHHAAEQGS